MTPGNVELVAAVCSMTVWTGGVAAVLSFDERRLTAEQLSRAWLPATRDAAVLGAFVFSAFYAAPALLLHFVRTRRSLAGVALGLLVPLAVLALDVGVELAAETAIEALGL